MPVSKHYETYAAIAPTLPQLSTASKSAFVTGGGIRGIGAAIATSLVRSGIAAIGLLGRQEAKLRETAAALQALSPAVAVRIYTADVRDAPAVAAALADFAGTTTSSRVDILIANAGYLPKTLQELSAYSTPADRADWWSVFEINVLGQLHAVQAFLPVAAADAAIVHISSVAADMPYVPGNAGYSASKAAATKLFEYVHHEHPNLFVAQVHPGLVLSTDMALRFGGVVEGYQGTDVTLSGDFVNWLVSPEARFLNGRFVNVAWDVADIRALAPELAADPRKLTIGIFDAAE